MKQSRFALGMRKFTLSSVYHEIRLLKPGNIADEAYPFSDFVDKLIRLGQKVVTHEQGFANAHGAKKDSRLQVISEICFETGIVESQTIDTDNFIFSENGRMSRVDNLRRKISKALKRHCFHSKQNA